MNGTVSKKGNRWYCIIALGNQPYRKCPTPRCRGGLWSAKTGAAICHNCGEPLDDPVQKRHQQWHGSWRTKQEAKDALTHILESLHTGTYVKPERLTLAQFVEELWLPTLALTVRPSTAESYTRNLRSHVLPRIGSTRLKDIDPPRLNGLYSELITSGRRGYREGTGLSPTTVRYIAAIIHRVFKDAVTWNTLARNPADTAKGPRAKDATAAAPDMQTWTAQELALFLQGTSHDRYGPAFHFLATTGMRRGEAIGLRWEDVNLTTGKVTIRRAIVTVNHKTSYGSTKTGRARVIELDDRTVAVLRQQRKRQARDRLLLGVGYQDEGLVFCHPDGHPYHPERFSREFNRKQATFNRDHAEAALPRLRLHDLRHTWATLALQSGEHPKIVADRLGHTTTNVTLNIYSHVVDGMQSQAAENVAALIFGARV